MRKRKPGKNLIKKDNEIKKLVISEAASRELTPIKGTPFFISKINVDPKTLCY